MKIIFSLLFIFLTGCMQQTKEISEGTYGPFSIGDTKEVALAKIEHLTPIRSIEPIPPIEVYLENPTLESIHVLDNSNGILVWLDHQPWPLRIELKDNIVVNKWGASDKCVASQSNMMIACGKIQNLSEEILIGSHRKLVYEKIASFNTNLSKQVGHFIIGLQEFRTGKNKSEVDYRTLLLANDAWQFAGLKELSKYENPFYSRVTLYFKAGKISHIKHWSAPYEML